MRHLFLVLFLLGVVQSTRAQSASPLPLTQGTLEAGASEERDLGADEVHPWTLIAEAGDYVEVELNRIGVEAEAKVFDPSGAERLSYTNDVSYLGTVTIRWLADVDGAWEVHVAPARPGLSGRYGIHLPALRPATAADLVVVDASEKRANAAALWEAGRYDDAEALQREALQQLQETPGIDSVEVANAHSDTADIYYYWGRYGAAAAHMEQALAIYEGLYGPEGGLTTLNNLASIYRFGARYRESEQAFLRALALREEVLGPRHPRVAITIDNLTGLYITQGRYTEAEALARRCLDIKNEAWGEDHYYLRWPLSYLTRIYRVQGRGEEAEAAARKALAVTERARGEGDRLVAQNLSLLAVVLLEQEQTDEAVPLLQRALDIAEAVLGADHPETADYVSKLGEAYHQLGNHEGAMQLFDRALASWRVAHGGDHPKVAVTRLHIAETLEATGALSAAAQAADEAIAILEASQAYPAERAKAYALRARVRKEMGDPRGALLDLEEALYAVESLRPNVGGGEEARAAFFGSYDDAFELMVQWKLEEGDAEAAFEYAERGRARAFLDQLAAGQVDLRASIPADIRGALEGREQDARARLAEYQQQLTFTRSREDLSDHERLVTIAVLMDSLSTADQDYTSVYADIKAASPLWRSYVTSGGEPVRFSEAQRALVPDGGLFLLYELGEESGYLFLIPPRGEEIEAIPLVLPEEAAAALGVEAGPLTEAQLRRVLGEPDALGLRTRGGAAADGSADRLHALWRTLLPEPVWARVAAATEVVVVPDGPLHHLPFEALVVAPGPDPARTRYWLDAGPPVRYAPSATALYNIARRPAPRVVPRAGAPNVLSLSVPIYDPAEVAVAEAAGTARPTDADLLAGTGVAALTQRTRNAYDRAGGVLVPLPGTARETEAIRAALGSEAGQVLVVLQGLEATEPRLRAALPEKRHVHLATHGLVDEGRGSLFAALALTPPTGLTRDLSDDGFLQLHEIYALDLAQTELAVLSACETAVGDDVGGGGAFALSRGFLAAGARRVVASQWAVDDASTAALVGAFFEEVTEAERAGRPLDAGRALFEAKRAVRAEANWAEPFFWAPFVIAGL